MGNDQVLTMGLYDATIVCSNVKYTYNVPRPFQRDSKFVPFLTSPKSPSYPSCHSVRADTAACILCCYFHEECDYWRKRAEEDGHSRLWAGVHYPIDHIAGKKLGQRLGQQVIISESESLGE